MTETTSTFVGKTLIHKESMKLVAIDSAYIGSNRQLLLSGLDDGRRRLIDWACDHEQYEEFEPVACY